MTGGTSVRPVAVVVVEDERDLREEVVDFLTDSGLAVRGAANGAELERLLGDEPADVVVLDLGLPSEDGISIAARLQARPGAPGIVMMTARGRVEERILGYQTGADIYLVKPVDYGELVAAIHATLRNRSAAQVTAPAGETAPGLAWRYDPADWRLSAPSGASLRLTRAEAQVLDCLTDVPGRPVSRDTIGLRMGKIADLGEHRYVDQVVSRLRRKVASELGWEAPIGSAHGQGYYIVGSIMRADD